MLTMGVKMQYLLFICLLQPACAQLIVKVCVVAQYADRTTYNISDVPQTWNTSCEYTWANATNHVLAHNNDQFPELVMRNSINALVTSECFNKLVYTLNCWSEVGRITVNCIFECAGKLGSQRKERDKDKEEINKGISPDWIAGIVAAASAAAVGLFLVIGLLLWHFRVCTGLSQSDELAAAEMQNFDLQAAHVEEGNV